MKRRKLIEHLSLVCTLDRHGAKHDVYRTTTGKMVSVPRHTEIDDQLARRIFKQVGLPWPG